MKRKIGIIINELYLGGAQRLVVDDIRELEERGIQVSLITLQSREGRQTFDDICVLPSERRHEVLFKSLFDLSALVRLIALMRRERYDVVMTHLWFSNTVGRIAARYAGVPEVISFEHNVYDDDKSWRPFLADRLLQGFSTRIVAVSRAVRESLIRHGIRPSRIVVLPNAIRTQDFHTAVDRTKLRRELSLPDDAFIFLSIGRLTRQKAHDTLLRAFKEVKMGYLLIAGEGELREYLSGLIVSLGLEGRVFLLGVRRDIPALLASADCFVQPSRWESISIVMLEALATGLPLIVADFAAAREVMHDRINGLVVPVDDAEQLADRMQEAQSSPKLREMLSHNARESAERYSIGAHVTALLAVLASHTRSRTVSVITFANLGKKQNLKTPDVLPVIETFSASGELEQVVCQLNSGFSFGKTVAAVPAFIRYPMRAYEKLSGTSSSRSTTERVFDLFASKRLARADVAFFHGGYFLPKTFAKAHSQGSILVDVAVAAHNVINAELEKRELEMLDAGANEGWYMRLAKAVPHTNAFAYVIAMSEFVKESYVRASFPREHIYVAHPDIDLARFAPRTEAKRDEAFRVVYAAYTTPLKGLHYLLDAWEQLRLPNAELVLVGGYGDMPEELKKRYDVIIAKNPSMRWVGSSAAPEEYYRSADVLVFPSLTEGFGRVTLEAMACGIPVITTENARGIVEDGKTGYIVPIRDAKAIAEKIQYLYDHRDVAAEMGREARRAVERKKPFGEAVYDIYQDILRREHKA